MSFRSAISVLVCVVGLVACKGPSGELEAEAVEHQKVWVRFHLPGCEEGSYACLQYQSGARPVHGAWRPLKGAIEGFTSEEGKVYQLKVHQEQTDGHFVLDEILVDSTVVPELDTPLDLLPEGRLRYRAAGTGPSWKLSMEEDGQIIFKAGRTAPIVVNYQDVGVSKGSLEWNLNWLEEPLNMDVHVWFQECKDALTGGMAPTRVEVVVGDHVFHGCGRFYEEEEKFTPLNVIVDSAGQASLGAESGRLKLLPPRLDGP